MFKAFIFGAVMTWAVALVLGTQGSNGGPLQVGTLEIMDVSFYWSWSLFLVGSGFFWALNMLQR